MTVLENVRKDSRPVRLDDDGCLEHFDDWDESVARELARREGIRDLTGDRLVELRFIREEYERYNYFPMPAVVCRVVGKPKDCLDRDFGSPLVAWKLAGLPHPEEPMVSLLGAGQSPG